MIERDMLTISDVAKMTRVDRVTIWRAMKRGEFSATRQTDGPWKGCYMIPRSEAARWRPLRRRSKKRRCHQA